VTEGVRALIACAEGTRFKTAYAPGFTQKFSLFNQQGMGTWLSSFTQQGMGTWLSSFTQQGMDTWLSSFTQQGMGTWLSSFTQQGMGMLGSLHSPSRKWVCPALFIHPAENGYARLSSFTQQGMGTWLSSELGEVNTDFIG